MRDSEGRVVAFEVNNIDRARTRRFLRRALGDAAIKRLPEGQKAIPFSAEEFAATRARHRAEIVFEE